MIFTSSSGINIAIRNGAAVNARPPRDVRPWTTILPPTPRPDPPRRRRLPAHHDQRVHPERDAGGFGRYERNHLTPPAATFAPHFSRLPPEIVCLVVERLPRGPPTKQATSRHRRAARAPRARRPRRRPRPSGRPRSGANHAPRARRARRRSGVAAAARQRAALAAAPIHGRSYSREAAGRRLPRRGQLRAVPLKDDGRVLATTAHVRRRSLVAARSAWNLRGHRPGCPRHRRDEDLRIGDFPHRPARPSSRSAASSRARLAEPLAASGAAPTSASTASSPRPATWRAKALRSQHGQAAASTRRPSSRALRRELR